MAHYNQDWDNLGRNIQEIVDRAVNSHDYQKLNQTIRMTVERTVGMGSEVIRKAVDGTSRSGQKAAAVDSVVAEKKDLPVLYGNPNKKTVGGIVRIVGGGLVCGFTVVGSLASMALNYLFGIRGGGHGGWLALAVLAVGIGLICSGVRRLNWVNRFKTYRKTLGDKTHCTLEKLARSVGKSVKYVRRELLQMIDAGLFLEGHMDKEETRLIVSDETYRLFEQSRLQLEQRKQQEAAIEAQKAAVTHAPQVQEVLDRGNAFIAEIRRCNDAIPGEAVSAKIDRMEMIVRKIFERVEEHPEVVSDLKKLMNYYLPMTVKLLNAYADMDAQPIQGDTIASSKREIEATLDTLNAAFEKLLDDLFADTAMDVSSDISVLNTLLAQEGLTEDDLTKMKNKQN